MAKKPDVPLDVLQSIKPPAEAPEAKPAEAAARAPGAAQKKPKAKKSKG